MSSTARARLVDKSGRQSLWFWCPGCETHHACFVRGVDGSRPQWSWNGSLDLPTLSPSVLASYEGYPPGPQSAGAPPKRCHSYVQNGRIQFLPDCTHALAGQTVDLDPIEASMGVA